MIGCLRPNSYGALPIRLPTRKTPLSSKNGLKAASRHLFGSCKSPDRIHSISSAYSPCANFAQKLTASLVSTTGSARPALRFAFFFCRALYMNRKIIAVTRSIFRQPENRIRSEPLSFSSGAHAMISNISASLISIISEQYINRPVQ